MDSVLRKLAPDKGSKTADTTNLDRHLAGRLESRSLNSTRSEAPQGVR